jgi:hypothetical protein
MSTSSDITPPVSTSDQAISDLRMLLADPNRVSKPFPADPRKLALRSVRKNR